MSFHPKPLFTWQEPEGFRQVLKEHERATNPWWQKPPAVTAFYFLSFMCSWWLVHNSAKTPVSFSAALLITLIAGFLMGYGVPWMISKLPFTFSVYEQEIRWTRGYAHRTGYSELKSFSWLHVSGFSILILNHRKGAQFLIGVPPDISADALTTFLLVRNVSQELDGGSEGGGQNQLPYAELNGRQ